jgi:hypothetical protein
VTRAQSQRPQSVDNDRFAFVVAEGAAAIPVRLKRVYCLSSEIADEDIAAEPA